MLLVSIHQMKKMIAFANIEQSRLSSTTHQQSITLRPLPSPHRPTILRLSLRKSQLPRLKLSTTRSPGGDIPKALSQRLLRLPAQFHPDLPSQIHGRRSSLLSFPCHGVCTGNAATFASLTPKQPSLVSKATAQSVQLPPARSPNAALTCLPSLLQQALLSTRP